MDNIIVAQVNFVAGAIDENFENIKRVIIDNPGSTIIFPELSLTGYASEDLYLDLNFLNKSSSYIPCIADIAHKAGSSVLLGAPIIENQNIFNAALFFSKGSYDIVHKKIYLPNSGVFDEVRYFKNHKVLKNFYLDGKNTICLICEDFWQIDESLLKDISKIELVVVINASPYESGKFEKRVERAQKLLSLTRTPIVYVNLVGGQDSLVFDGNSFVMYSHSEVLKLGHCQEEIVNLKNFHLENYPIKESEIYEVLCLGVRDYFFKNNQHTALVALSGGIDSALCTAIVIDALGVDKVKVVTMPSKFTSNLSYTDAGHLINAYNLEYLNIPIGSVFGSLQSSLEYAFEGYAEDVTEENMQSRIRGLIIMSLANKYNSLVVTTGNKSEYSCGYATIYGDMCGAIAPIKDVLKTDVFKLAKWRNSNIPKSSKSEVLAMFSDSVLTKEPSAELRFDQRDSDSLPSYENLDRFLYEYIEKKIPAPFIHVDGIDEAVKYDLVNKIKNSEYKRRQSAIGIKVSSCSFDKDWRFPITNNYKI